MRIVLIADAFPPMRTSGAVQMRDLAQEFLQQGDRPTVLVPTPGLGKPWLLESIHGVEVLRLDAPRTKDVGYIRRALGELLMPLAMLWNFRRSPLANVRWDGVIWYSPSIFLAAVAHVLKAKSACASYLIVRDIFPEWAVDMGLMRRGLPYYFFKLVERYQYTVADTIGAQSHANLAYFDKWVANLERRVEVLQNWLATAPNIGCSIRVAEGPLRGRKIFVYAGNIGVAQGMDILIDLAERLRHRNDIGFLFVGRGSEARRLRDEARRRGLDNVIFHDEVDPAEIAGLYAQCHVGIVALDPRHKTHNVPGKFLSYMQAGLPVLASINRGNDLAVMIERERVGRACSDHSVDTLEKLATQVLDSIETDAQLADRCRALFANLFSPKAVVRQVAVSLMRYPTAVREPMTLSAPVVHAMGETDLQHEEA
jgi:glycosyltransferase involved in cell wall biosynthesis